LGSEGSKEEDMRKMKRVVGPAKSKQWDTWLGKCIHVV